MQRINWFSSHWMRTKYDLNEIRVFEDYCEMDLYTRNYVTSTTTFDLDILDQVKDKRWTRYGTHRYAVNEVRFRSPRLLYLQHLALPKINGMMVDHIDGDVLNNRRSNLRYATNAQNQYNTDKVRGLSKYKGVSYCTTRDSWRGGVKHNYRTYSSKDFKTEEEAAMWVQRKREELHGEFTNHGGSKLTT